MHIWHIVLTFLNLTLLIKADEQQKKYALMTYEEYTGIRHEAPYMFSSEKNNQHIYYFGANHSRDPNNAQFPILEAFWQEFLDVTDGKNCAVLVEGALRTIGTTKEACSDEEGCLITFLASEKNIPVFCPEPRKSYAVRKLLKNYPIEHIAYMDFAQANYSAHHKKEVAPDINLTLFAEFILEDFTRFFKQCFYDREFTLDMIKAVHREIFNNELDIDDKEFFYNICNPVVGTTVINKICRANSIIRDKHIIKYIEALLGQGKNIFAVYGATHAVMQEPALIKICRPS